MTMHSWLVYLTLVFVATATPGPAVLFIVTNSALHGWKKAVFAALGNILGLFCLGVLAIAGLGTILKASEPVFEMIKYAGAAYLIFMGLTLILRKSHQVPGRDLICSRPLPAGRICIQAFGVAMSNPKAIIFLTALFPQFINVNQALIPQFAILICTLMTLSFAFLMFYALLAHSARAWLNSPNRVRAVHRASGSIFIGFGALLAASFDR